MTSPDQFPPPYQMDAVCPLCRKDWRHGERCEHETSWYIEWLVQDADEIDRLRARIDAVRKVWRTYRQAPSRDLADALNSLIDPEVDHDQP